MMYKTKKNICDYTARAIIVSIVFLFAYIVFGYLMREVCYKRLHINHPVVDYFVQMEVPENGQEGETDGFWGDSIVSDYLNRMNDFKSSVEAYSKNIVPLKTEMTYLCKCTEALMGYDIRMVYGKEDMIYLKNGYLGFSAPKVAAEDMDEIADSVESFRNYLDTMDIPFLYVNAGSKVCPVDKQLYPGSCEFTNENGDDLMEAFRERGILYLDIRQEMLQTGQDWYSFYYITDHHYKTETGLWVAGILADTLNTEYGYAFEPWKFAPENWNIDVYEDYWVGGQGRQDMLIQTDLEAFSLLTPQYDTDYTVKIQRTYQGEWLTLQGSYSEVLFEMDLFEKIADYTKEDHLVLTDAYHCSQMNNDAVMHIINHLPNGNENKKILFLADSFMWYTIPYLAADIGKIDVLCPGRFEGSIEEYVEETRPDMVIMAYGEFNIEKINWDSHRASFDLR